MRVKRVEVSALWPNIGREFPKWLGDNLEHLGEEAGVSLAGTIRGGDPATGILVDLDDDRGRAVVLASLAAPGEGLVGLVTSALARQGTSNVVILLAGLPQRLVPSFEWLNRQTGGSIRIVRLEAIRIDDNEPAPLLTRILPVGEAGRPRQMTATATTATPAPAPAATPNRAPTPAPAETAESAPPKPAPPPPAALGQRRPPSARVRSTGTVPRPGQPQGAPQAPVQTSVPTPAEAAPPRPTVQDDAAPEPAPKRQAAAPQPVASPSAQPETPPASTQAPTETAPAVQREEAPVPSEAAAEPRPAGQRPPRAKRTAIPALEKVRQAIKARHAETEAEAEADLPPPGPDATVDLSSDDTIQPAPAPAVAQPPAAPEPPVPPAPAPSPVATAAVTPPEPPAAPASADAPGTVSEFGDGEAPAPGLEPPSRTPPDDMPPQVSDLTGFWRTVFQRGRRLHAMFQDAQAEGAEAIRVPGPRKGMSWTTEGEGDGAVLGMSLDYGPAGAADNAWAYQELVDLRYDIEGDFRGILTYQTLEGGAGSRITARIGPLHVEDQANWPDQADHVVARLADFVTALCSRLPDDDDLEI